MHRQTMGRSRPTRCGSVLHGCALPRARWAPLAIALLITGCVTVDLPSIAHVHVGHAITGWNDTPGGRGLCDVAQDEAAVASEHAAFAVEGARDPQAVRLHLGHVLHAVDPTREPAGPGTGYGLLKALDGCIDHLGFAADVRDASPNLKAGVPTLVATLQPLGREVRTIAVLAADARRSPDAALALAYAQDVRQRCDRLLVTLVQARQRLDALLAAEQPPYRPVARHYLFGIIRLPSGDWAWASAGQRGGGYAPHH